TSSRGSTRRTRRSARRCRASRSRSRSARWSRWPRAAPARSRSRTRGRRERAVIALLGNLSRDLLPGEPPRPGGAPYHPARAFRRLHVPGRIVARCAVEDRAELFDPVVRLGTAARYVPGTASASFEISYEGDHRLMRLAALGDVWRPEDVPLLPDAVRWVHVA